MSFVKWCELCQSEGIQSPVCLFQINFTEAVQMCKRPECLDLVKARDFQSLIIQRDLSQLLQKGPTLPPCPQPSAQRAAEKGQATEPALVSSQDGLETFLALFDDGEPQQQILGGCEDNVQGAAEKFEKQTADRCEVQAQGCSQLPLQSTGQASDLLDEETANASGVDAHSPDLAQAVRPVMEDLPRVPSNELGGSRDADCSHIIPIEVAEHNYTRVNDVASASTDVPLGSNMEEHTSPSDPCGSEAPDVVDFGDTFRPEVGSLAWTADELRANCAKDYHLLQTSGEELATEPLSSTVISDIDAVTLCTPDDAMAPCLRIADSMYHAVDNIVHDISCVEMADDSPRMAGHFILDLGASVDVMSQETLSFQELASEGGSEEQRGSGKSQPTGKVSFGPSSCCAAVEGHSSELVLSRVAAGKVLEGVQSQDLVESSCDTNTLDLSLPVGNMKTFALSGHTSRGGDSTLGIGSDAQKGQPTTTSKNGVGQVTCRPSNAVKESASGVAEIALPTKRSRGGSMRSRANGRTVPTTANGSTFQNLGDKNSGRGQCKVQYSTSQGQVYCETVPGANSSSGSQRNIQVAIKECVSSPVAQIVDSMAVGCPAGYRPRTTVRKKKVNRRLPRITIPEPPPSPLGTPTVLNKLAMISTVLESAPLPKEAEHSSPRRNATAHSRSKRSKSPQKNLSSDSASYAALHESPEKKQKSLGTSRKKAAPQHQTLVPMDTSLPDFSPLHSPSGSEDGSLSSKPSSGGGSDGMHSSRSGWMDNAVFGANVSSTAFVRMVKDQIRAKRGDGSGFPGYHPVLAKKPPYVEEKKPRVRTQRKAAAAANGEDSLSADLDRIVSQMGSVEDHTQYDSILNELFQMA